MAGEECPVIGEDHDFGVYRVTHRKTGAQSMGWIYFTEDDTAYLGTSRKRRHDLTRDDLITGLKRVDNADIYPEPPASPDTVITVAPDGLASDGVFAKRPPLLSLTTESWFTLEPSEPATLEGDEPCGIKDRLLKEVLITEKISKIPHPYITLLDYAHDWPRQFAQLDKEAMLAGVESAVRFLHSLGLAHNDINPNNIMVREHADSTSTPVLIDFDSTGPFGCRILSGGTPGFADKDDPDMFVSLKRHDDYSLERLRVWWDDRLKSGADGAGTDPESSED